MMIGMMQTGTSTKLTGAKMIGAAVIGTALVGTVMETSMMISSPTPTRTRVTKVAKDDPKAKDADALSAVPNGTTPQTARPKETTKTANIDMTIIKIEDHHPARATTTATPRRAKARKEVRKAIEKVVIATDGNLDDIQVEKENAKARKARAKDDISIMMMTMMRKTNMMNGTIKDM